MLCRTPSGKSLATDRIQAICAIGIRWFPASSRRNRPGSERASKGTPGCRAGAWPTAARTAQHSQVDQPQSRCKPNVAVSKNCPGGAQLPRQLPSIIRVSVAELDKNPQKNTQIVG